MVRTAAVSLALDMFDSAVFNMPWSTMINFSIFFMLLFKMNKSNELVSELRKKSVANT